MAIEKLCNNIAVSTIRFIDDSSNSSKYAKPLHKLGNAGGTSLISFPCCDITVSKHIACDDDDEDEDDELDIS
jgi:hypothetical protein